MMTQSKLSLPLALLLLFVMACTCGKTGNTNNSNSNNSNNSNSSTSNSNESNDNSSTGNKNSSTTSGSTASTGIPECDEYLKKIEEYLNCPNVPEASREQWRKQRDETAQRIKQAGQTEAGKNIMAGACSQMTEAVKDELAKCK